MDTVVLRDRVTEFLKKYKYAAIIVLTGVILMCLPGKTEKVQPTEMQKVNSSAQKPEFSNSLEDILSQIKGAGRVKVLLTESAGAETIFQMNEDTNEDTDGRASRMDVVVITGADRNQTGLIRQVNPPEYLGAVIVCEGAGNPDVRLAIVQAVRSVTGLGADHITVLKMK